MKDLLLEALGERSIRMTRAFHASKELVYRSWTEPALVQRWLLGPDDHWTMPVCEIDLRVGGSYRFVWRHAIHGNEMGLRGEYLEIIPNEKLVTTEVFDEAWYPGTARITLTLEEASGVTTMVSVIEYDSAATRDGVMKSPMETGVRASYNRLESIVEG